jgi:hypothetical protein
VSLEPIEVEVMCIMANCMEHCHLLVEKVLDTSQDKVFCLAGFTYSQQIAEKAIAAKGQRSFNEMVPIHYCNFTKVFSPMSVLEQKELDKFLDKNNTRGYLRPSKSLMASLVFFIKKKDSSL